MLEKRATGRSGLRPRGHLGCFTVLAVAATLLSGCGGAGLTGSPSAGSPSLGDRFSQLFGSKSQAADAPATPRESQGGELTCPPVSIRAGASTYAVGLPGKEATATDLRYQATIVRTARDCNLNGGMITARIGIQGRVIVGPAGAPATVEIPVRVAVVQGGINEKTIFTKAYRTTVTVSEDGTNPYSLVAEDIVYPAPSADVGDSYIFYIGFDPQALRPEPKSRSHRRK
jgi:hypothetical protein